MFLMLTRISEGGKSTLVNVIEGVINWNNCTVLCLVQMAGCFGMNRLHDKTLLSAKEIKTNFLNSCGTFKLKALVGRDVLSAEAKG